MIRIFLIFVFLILVITSCQSKIPSKIENNFYQTQIEKEIVIEVPGRPRNPIFVDLDKDGQKELVVISKSPWLYVFKQKENNFILSKRYETYTHNTKILALDIDQDEDIDLLPITEALIGPIFINDGKGNLLKKTIKIRTPKFGYDITAFNFNADKYPDLAAIGLLDEVIYVYINKQARNFKLVVLKPPPSKNYFGNQKGYHEIKAIDINHDGKDDVLITDYFGQRVLLAIKEDHSFKFEEIYSSDSTIASSYLWEDLLVVAEEAKKRLVFLEKKNKFQISEVITIKRAFPRKIISNGTYWAVFWVKPGGTLAQIYKKNSLLIEIEFVGRRCENGYLDKNIIWCSDVLNNELAGKRYETQ